MCGVPRRFIGDGVSLFRDVAHFASTSGSPVAILSLDQDKRSIAPIGVSFATPWSAWSSARLSLAGSIFFYAGIQSAVKVNDFVTPCFRLPRGVR